jgi:hypothetical protein
MKKNLTLLMMLAAFVGILSAQSGPKFNYQAVVRNADTLVYNQAMTITIEVNDGTHVYTEKHDTTSTQNGFVSVMVGDGAVQNQSAELVQIDWSKATIKATFEFGGNTVTSTMPVTPVPYAIQAGGAPLTTERIANYMKNTLTTDDARDILNALILHNSNLKNDLEDTIKEYMKAHKDIAMDVAKAYLGHINSDDVQELYDAVNANTEAKDKLRALLKQYIIDNRELAKDVVIWYLRNADANDIARAYATVQDIPDGAKQAFMDYLENYLKTQENRSLLYNFGVYVIKNVTSEEAAQAFAYFEANNNDVKIYVRNILNGYIDEYINVHYPNGINLTAEDAVNHAVDNYIQSNHMLRKSANCTVDFCALKNLHDQVMP